MFVVAGNSGTVITSPDGVTWTSQTTPGTAQRRAAAWSPELGLFVVGGADGTVITSPDGETWTDRTTPGTAWRSAAAWSPELGLFVVAGFDGTVITSPDGVTWTDRTTPGTEHRNAAAWSPELGLFVVAGNNFAGSQATIITSPDGETWTSRIAGTQRLSATWSPELGLFVAGGLNGTVITSPDGETWTDRTTPGTDNRNAATWSPELGLFVVAGANGTIITSPDGVTWTSRTTPGTEHRNAATWSPELGLFVVAGGAGTIITSPDGETWTSRTTPGTDIRNAAVWAGVNEPPHAPTLGYPTGGVTIDRGVTQRFTWDFDDPDEGDTQSAYELRWRQQGTSEWSTTTQQATPNEFHDFAPGHFAAGDWEWQARTWDADGEPGPWSGSESFTAASTPDAPTITDPANNATIPTESYDVTWSTPVQDAYQLRRVADDAGDPDETTVLFDTGTVQASGARSRTVEFPVNNTHEHIQVRVRVDGLWSTWASVRVEVAYTPPAQPTVTVTADTPVGAISVQAAHPEPVGEEPAVIAVDVHRRRTGDTSDGIRVAAGIEPTATHVDWAVASGVAYEYRARAIGDNGVSNWSDWTP